VLAQSFGSCKCGYAKADHSPAALLDSRGSEASVKGSPSAAALRASRHNADADTEDAAKADCAFYVVDVAAGAFGQCKCGAPKAMHTEEALIAAGNNGGNSGGSGSGSPKKAALSDSGSGGGAEEEARGRGSEAAGRRTPARTPGRRSLSPRLKPPEALHVECRAYVVDVLAATFGACKCGHAKAAHSPAALSDGAAERMDATKADKWQVPK
jgi:hypothetical protein